MNIIQQPDPLSLSLNLKEFLIASDSQVSFILRQGDAEVLSQRYDPPVQGYIAINLKDVIHGRLSTVLKDFSEPYEQPFLASDFIAVIDGTEVSFKVIRGGIDRLADSATNFLTQNFLTWQPSIKPVTYYTPEFLTYYAVVSSTVRLRAYFTDESGAITSQMDYTILDLAAGTVYTIPLQYSVVAGWLGHKLPAYYDVWVENISGERLTYIQRYYAEDMRSEQEQWILFENSLGGFDTFRAYGNSTMNGEHTHNIAETDEESQEYRVDTERKVQKNTGYLNDYERKWLLDFFPSKGKFIYVGDYLRRIVVTESNVSYSTRDLPSNYTFTFKYADAKPLLNLPRTEEPAEVLNITVPSVGSFTLPPRLAEISRLSLSGGALFPVQNPYSETWSTTTMEAMGAFFADLFTHVYGGGGGIGHHHRNFSLLELLSFIDSYLLVDDQKISAGYADTAGKIKDDVYLYKDRPDSTKFLLSLLGGAIFGKEGFASGLTGFGAKIDDAGNGEMESLVLRRFLEVPELRFNRVSIVLGDKWSAPGAGIIERIEEDTDSDGNLLMTGTGWLKLEEGEYGAIAVGDICMGIFHSEIPGNNATADSDDSLGNFQYAGFYTTYFTITEITGANNKQFRYQLRPTSERWSLTFHPCQSMHFVCYGSFTDAGRQTSQYTTRTYARRLWKQNTWEISVANIAAQEGDLSNLSIHGLEMHGYSAYLNNVYFTGVIKQIKPDGTPVLTANERGAWVAGHYDFYDRVSHDGRIWLCVNEDGTNSEPSENNADWLLQVDKGLPGVPGKPGNDGKILYTWIRYADDANGNGISDNPTGKKFLGLAYNKESAVESNNPKDYQWSNIKGEDGIGVPGADGKTYYTWVAYSDNADGSGMYQQPNDNTRYIGIAINKDTAVESNNPGDYTWSKFRGDDGKDGESVILADLDNEMDSVALTYEGRTTASTVLNTTVGMWYGSEKLPLKSIACATPAGVTASHNVNTGGVALTVVGGVEMPERSQVKITVTATWQGVDYSRDLVFTIAGVRAGSPGADAVLYRLVPSVSSVSKRKDGTYSVASVSCTRTKSAGGNTAITTDGVLKYSKDGGAEVEIQNDTAISPKNFTSSLQFVYYVDGQVVDRETVPIVVDGADGKPGTQGIPGIPGKDGKILYTWIRYADDANGGGISNNPTGKKFLGLAYNKESAVESNNPEDYQWSNIKGEDGIGVPGADGKTYYTWVAYSDNADGTGMYQQPNDNTRYIGIAINKDTSVESSNPGDYTWSKFRGDDGKDGISITNCGAWHTGLHVPYMGLTKMAERVFLCTNPAGTDNPPMWTITDKDGNRLLQTQDGGRTYGYIITGELNTAEYELLVENGKDGRDGTDHEWIFKHTTENVAPATPGTAQVDDYVPSGWNDDAIGVSESLPYEWACSRTKKDGIWSAFTPTALWAKFGFDGESVILADIDNEMDSVALTYEGRTTGATVLNATVGMWYGTEKLPLKSIACAAPAGVTTSYNVNTGVIALTVAGGVAMPERSQVKISVTATWQGVDYNRDLVFTIAGVRAGSPGADAVLYRLVPSVSSVSKRKDGTYSVASVSCTRTKSAGGNTAVTTDGVLKYSKDGGAEVEIQNGTSISPRNFTSSLQFVYYVNGQVVDRETVPMVVDGEPGEDGVKGDSVSNHGRWQTGKHIPYLGIVRMGNSTWQCTTPAGSDNPPMWTVTDKDGNRLLQTQDGGATYGYILTGEVNTAEYELVAQDGTDGKPGEPGKDGESIKGEPGEQGIQGCILRKSEWKVGVEWRNDESLTSGTRYLDIALVRDNSLATGWQAYKCKVTHTSSASNAPGNTTYWEEFGMNTTSIFTSLIIAKDAKIDLMQGNQLLIRKDDGTVTAGLSGSQSGSKVRIWAGGSNPDNAPFRVTEAGKLIAANADITGNITAQIGKIGGFTIENGSLYWKGLDYFLGDSRSVRIGVSTDSKSGLIDIDFNAATTGRFGIKIIGSNSAGACIYASRYRSETDRSYPVTGNTYAGYFDGSVFVSETLSSELCLADKFGVVTSKNADGSISYYEGVDFNFGSMIFRKGILVNKA